VLLQPQVQQAVPPGLQVQLAINRVNLV